MSKLKNKIAVITGGSAGIGLATAKEFANQGAKVIITGRNQQTINEALKELGQNVIGIQADSSNLKDIDQLVNQVKSAFGTIDILFVNAGIAVQEPVGQISEASFDTMMNTNFKGAVFTTEKFIPVLNDGGAIIHNTSVSAFQIATGVAIYGATKAALTRYSKAVATELAGRKIRVNTIAPAMTETPGIYRFAGEEVHSFIREMMPFKRYGKADEVAKLVAFLASDDASFISGAEYTIDSGASVNAVRI